MRRGRRLWGIGVLAVAAVGCAMGPTDDGSGEGALPDVTASSDPLRCTAGTPTAIAIADAHGGEIAARGASQNHSPLVVTRFDSTCRTLWEYRAEDGIDRLPATIAVDGADGVFVGGAAFSAAQPVMRWRRDINVVLLLKLSADGQLAWSHEFPGVGKVEGVYVASNGDVVALGMFDSPLDLGGGALRDSSINVSTFLARFDGEGRFLWNKNLGDRYNLRVLNVTFDADDGVIVTGRLKDFDFGNGPLHAPKLPQWDERPMRGFVARYDAAGNLLSSEL